MGAQVATATAAAAWPHGGDWPLVWLAAALVVLGLGYGFAMLWLSRRTAPAMNVAASGGTPAAAASGAAPEAGAGFFVFLMPCLNEELVIEASLRRLLSLPAQNVAIMVIDDGSDDGTAAAVTGLADERVWLLSRTKPHARQGKGEALNAALADLASSGRLAGRDPDDVIIAVVDADGRLDPHALSEVAPYFADPAVGAVQIGVRINNRDRSLLARMQDMEFVIYTEVFQRGRRHLGSVGLGGNGQFVRLSALRSLGPAPWTRSLTEDLDLGVRLAAAGWRNEYCPAASVHQQGVVELRRLINQRARWFQGNLQAWRLIPLVLRRVRRGRTDLLYLLSAPALLLIASLLTVSFLFFLANGVVLAATGHNPFGWWAAVTYALIVGPALVYTSVYWKCERAHGLRLRTAVGLAHVYAAYSTMWYLAGWRAAVRALRGHTGWAKTDRVAEGSGATAGKPTPARAPVPALVPARAPVPVPAPVPALVPALGPPPPPSTVPAPTPGPEPSPAPEPGPEPSPAPEPGPEPSPARRGRRRPLAAAAVAVIALATLATLTFSVLGGHNRARGPWLTVFTGHGLVTGTRAGRVITLSPQRTTAPHVTHAALVVSARQYRNFTATLTVRTLGQFRRAAAGSPHPWEVGWVLWHVTSQRRFYALTLERHGWVLSKQDPAYRGGERFLASGRAPGFAVGRAHRVTITQVGATVTVWADGRLLTRFTDKQQPYLSGSMGLYCEDSAARFQGIHVGPVRAGAGTPARPLAVRAAQSSPRAGRGPPR